MGAAAPRGAMIPATVVPLVEAALRTGLADDAAGLRSALTGHRSLVPVGSGIGVDLAALVGGTVEIVFGDVVVTDSGVLR